MGMYFRKTLVIYFLNIGLTDKYRKYPVISQKINENGKKILKNPVLQIMFYFVYER